MPYGSHSGAAAIGAVAPAPVAVNAADLQRHWLHCTCQPIVSRISCDLALAGCHMAVTAAQRQSALLHLRRECAARICVGGSECSRPQVACSGNGAAPLAPQHVPAHRESQQLRPCSSWVPYGSHSGAAAIGAVAPAWVAVTPAAIAPALRPSAEQVRPGTVQAACIQTRAIAMPRAAPLAPLHVPAHRESNQLRRFALAGCRVAVTAAQRQPAQLHLRRWQ